MVCRCSEAGWVCYGKPKHWPYRMARSYLNVSGFRNSCDNVTTSLKPCVLHSPVDCQFVLTQGSCFLLLVFVLDSHFTHCLSWDPSASQTFYSKYSFLHSDRVLPARLHKKSIQVSKGQCVEKSAFLFKCLFPWNSRSS